MPKLTVIDGAIPSAPLPLQVDADPLNAVDILNLVTNFLDIGDATVQQAILDLVIALARVGA